MGSRKAAGLTLRFQPPALAGGVATSPGEVLVPLCDITKGPTHRGMHFLNGGASQRGEIMNIFPFRESLLTSLRRMTEEEPFGKVTSA